MGAIIANDFFIDIIGNGLIRDKDMHKWIQYGLRKQLCPGSTWIDYRLRRIFQFYKLIRGNYSLSHLKIILHSNDKYHELLI